MKPKVLKFIDWVWPSKQKKCGYWVHTFYESYYIDEKGKRWNCNTLIHEEGCPHLFDGIKIPIKRK